MEYSSLDDIGFEDMKLPEEAEIVYILYYKENQDGKEIPFYIGDTSGNISRVMTFATPYFKGSTSFKIAEVINCLQENGCEVGIKYKCCSDRKEEKQRLLEELGEEFDLLNEKMDFSFYTREEKDKLQEKQRIESMVNHDLLEAK